MLLLEKRLSFLMLISMMDLQRTMIPTVLRDLL